MRTVLVTRAAADAGPLCEALAAAGLRPVRVPLLERRLCVQAVAAAARRPVDGWVLTSAAAVDALAAAGAEPPGWIAAVGPRTAAAAAERGWAVDSVPPSATAAAMLAHLGDRTGQRILYPRADLAGPEVRRGLEALGAVVYEVVAYENRQPAAAAAQLDAAWPVDVVTLLSGSAARRLVALRPLPWPEETRVVVIGPSTARVAEQLGLQVAAVAEPHTVEGVVAAID